ncbi:MAG TPA: choice-of-anchor D domain-containing protein, partial [Terriglobia bacterium]|nr:choice-of-anchor D domain-containing protein [Terriglobia bacterium]
MTTKLPWVRAVALMALCFCMSVLAPAASTPVKLSPSSVTFGTYIVGTTSPASLVTLLNNQATTLTITNITTTGDFAQTNNCGGSVAPHGGCTISVKFTPTAVGARAGMLTVTDNAGNTPQTATLSGTGSVTGLASISVTPANPSVPLGL